MVGMESWMLWLGWFIYGMIPMFFAIILIVIFMKIPLFETEYPPIEYSDGSVLFLFLLLYCMAANIFCFALSSCFSNRKYLLLLISFSFLVDSKPLERYQGGKRLLFIFTLPPSILKS